MQRVKFEIEVATGATKTHGPASQLQKVLEHWDDLEWNGDRTEGNLDLRDLTIKVAISHGG